MDDNPELKKFCITADWHLGKTQYNNKQREQDFYNAAFAVLKHCNENGIKYIINAGDIFDLNKPKLAAVKCLKDINKFLIDNNMTMVTMMGNHDFTSDGSWCDIFNNNSEFGIKDVSDSKITIDGVSICGIVGKTRTEILEGLEKDFAVGSKIMILHCPCYEVVGSDFGQSEDVFSVYRDFVQNPELAKKYDACRRNTLFAIGDTHKFVSGYNIIHEGLDTLECAVYVSPGSTEMVYANEDISKYVAIVTVDTANDKFQIKECKKQEIDLGYVRITNGAGNPIKSEEELDKFIEEQLINSLDLTKRVMVYLYYYADAVPDIEQRVANVLKPNPLSGIRLIPKINPAKVNLNVVNKEGDSSGALKTLHEFASESQGSFFLSEQGKSLFIDILNKEYSNEQIKERIEAYALHGAKNQNNRVEQTQPISS